MPTELRGKGMWIWQLDQCEGGDPQRILDRARQAGLTNVLVKVADGTNLRNPGVEAFVPVLQQGGLLVWGWQYTYGHEPEQEAAVAAERIATLHLDGFTIDAEAEYNGQPIPAQRYARELRSQVGEGVPLALSSFYLPNLHMDFPYAAFLEHCDWAMPQIYWYTRDPVQALEQSVEQQARFGRPVFPTGAAYPPAATAEQIGRFLLAAKQEGLPGANFWSWQHALPQMWQVIAGLPWTLPRLIAALPQGKEWSYHEVPASFANGQFLVRSQELAASVGQTGGTDTLQPVRSAVAELGWQAEFMTQHLADPSDPRVYLFVTTVAKKAAA